jgi:glycosyltransferase involved in cell wall biosynthesis
VLFLIDELDIGGTEQQLLELVKRLDRRAYLPMVCCFRPGRIAEEIAAAGVPMFHLRKHAKVDLSLLYRLWRLMRRERIELLQTYLFTANTWGRLAAIMAGVPLIVSSERNVDMWEKPSTRRIARGLSRWTDATIANSTAVQDYLVRRGLTASKIQVIYNGVDAGRFASALAPDRLRHELGIPPQQALVGLIARLEPQKDIPTFLQAAAQLIARRLHVYFLVIGGGSLQEQLQQQAQTLGLAGRVIFTGPRRDVPRLLAACDISVMSSLKEGMSNTILESMMAGKPVVATSVGGNTELIQPGKTGFLVPPRDPVALAAAIQELVDDPSLAQAMGRRAHARIRQHFSVEAMVAATQRLYDGLVQSSRRPSALVPPAPASTDTEANIAFVVSQFPRHVDAYFLRELTALAARGVRFQIFSLRRFRSKVVHAEARPLLARTVYVPFFSWQLIQAHLNVLARMPGRYFGAFGTLLRGCWRQPRLLLRALAAFPKAVYFATLVQPRQLRHIHANWATHPAMSALVMSRLSGVPWSFTGHASDIYLHTAMLAEKLQAAKFVITCTRYNRDYLVRLAGEAVASKIVVSYHGIDLAKFQPIPKSSAPPFRVLAVGTLMAGKGFSDLIAACRILASRGLACDCTIVGDGRERRRLTRLIRRAGLSAQVRITGYLPHESLIHLYQQAHVVVLPARSESHFGIPNVLLEAMAVETPVVCTPLPSLAEVVRDGQHGLYVPERDPVALANALATLARDPQRCRAMGTAGRRTIEALFDAATNVNLLAAMFCTEPQASWSTVEAASSAAHPSATVLAMTSQALADPVSGES